MPIWLDYMSDQIQNLEIEKNTIPENISFVRINSDTGKIDNKKDIDSYFELFLDENIKN